MSKKLQQRIQRFINLNSKMRTVTLKSEQSFLKLAGNISAPQLQLILAIAEYTDCTMSQLAKILHFSQANITQMVDRLINKKYLKRTRSKMDRRIVYVSLLPKAEKIVVLHREHVINFAKDWFKLMTDIEQETMLNLLEKYIEVA